MGNADKNAIRSGDISEYLLSYQNSSCIFLLKHDLEDVRIDMSRRDFLIFSSMVAHNWDADLN